MTTETENAPAVKASPKTISTLLEAPSFKEAVAKSLPKHLTADRFVRVAVTAIARTPKLALCTRESLFACLYQLSAFGLEPDGRRAHLIPFEDKRNNKIICTVIVDYKGLAELVYRSGVVSYLHADVVREGDVFEFSKGELRQHVPWFLRRDAERPESAGTIFAAYALARMKDSSEKAEVLALSEVMSIRDNSQGWRAFKAGYAKQSPWDPKNPVSEQEMMKKTAFRRLTKWLPLSPEIRDAVESEDIIHGAPIDIEIEKVNGVNTRRVVQPASTNVIEYEAAAEAPEELPTVPADDAPSAEADMARAAELNSGQPTLDDLRAFIKNNKISLSDAVIAMRTLKLIAEDGILDDLTPALIGDILADPENFLLAAKGKAVPA